MNTLKSKLPNVGVTIFTEINELAVRHNAINLGQGFPDYNVNGDLHELVADAMRKGFNQYTHMNGFPPLRQKLASKIKTLYNADVDPDSSITVTPGGTYAIYTAVTTLIKPGDEAIVFEPAYDSYIPNIELNGGKVITIPLSFPDYSIPWDAVNNAITERTKLIILNSPHNPTGAVLTERDIAELQKIVAKTGIFIVSDEVYEHLIYDGKAHLSLLKYPYLANKSFVCFSFGKTYSCTGWKLGYCIAPPELMKEFRKVHQFNCFTCDTPKQIALTEYIDKSDVYLSLAPLMESKRNFLRELLKKTPFKLIPSHGSYFECYSYDHFSQESDREFAARLIRECGVATIPVSAFYRTGQDDHVVRFCFAKKESTLEEAAKRILKLF